MKISIVEILLYSRDMVTHNGFGIDMAHLYTISPIGPAAFLISGMDRKYINFS